MAKKRKNSNYNYSPVTVEKKKKGNRPVVIFVSVFCALVLSLGVVLGVIAAVGSSSALLEYEGLTMDAKTVSYFSSYYKYRYIAELASSGVRVYDDDEFWGSLADDGKTYGEHLSEDTEGYLRQILVANYLYDLEKEYGKDEREAVDKAVEEILLYRADGDVRNFNSQAAEFGFDYKTFKNASKLLYKAENAQKAIYGADGSYIKNYPDLCNTLMHVAYSHVHLIFIRTKDTFVLDENGNRVLGNDNFYETRLLTEVEKQQREEIIGAMDAAIAAIDNGGNIQMTEDMFFRYQERYDEGDRSKRQSGYYFSADSSYSKEFATAYAAVVEKSLSMDISRYAKVETSEGVCYIFKDFVEDSAYLSSTNREFFTDFYKQCAAYAFSDSLSQLEKKVTVSDKYDKNAVISMPYNAELVAHAE